MEMNGNVNRVFVSADSLHRHFPWLLRCRWDIPGVSSKCYTVTRVNRVGDRTAMPEDAAWTRLLWQALRWSLSRSSKDSRLGSSLRWRRGVSQNKVSNGNHSRSLLKKPSPNIEKKKCVEKLDEEGSIRWPSTCLPSVQKTPEGQGAFQPNLARFYFFTIQKLNLWKSRNMPNEGQDVNEFCVLQGLRILGAQWFVLYQSLWRCRGVFHLLNQNSIAWTAWQRLNTPFH